jgi:hypothetical protein
MIDDFDDDQSPEEARDALDHELRTVGARAAYQALLEVCQDTKAPAPARATSGTALLRAAGYFNRENDRDEKPIHELSMDEIERRIQKLNRQSAEPKRQRRRRDGPDVFD